MNNNVISFEMDNDEKFSIFMDMKAECKTVCQHKFQFKCILNWFKEATQCPNCSKIK